MSAASQPLARSRRGVVAAGHEAAADAGARVLVAGGNAVDAVVAAAFAAFVAEPSNCGLGGYGHLSLYLAGRGEFVTIDHSGRAPRRTGAGMFETGEETPTDRYAWPSVAGDLNSTGYLAPAVPGAVSGLCEAHDQGGRLPFEQVLQPAVDIAEAGLEVTWKLALAILERLPEIRAFPQAAGYLLRDGDPPRATGYSGPGDRLDASDLAATLRLVAREGRDGFYTGPVAAAIERAVAAGGGVLSAEDLASYQPKVIRETPADYRGTAYVTANDQVGREVLNILAHFPLGDFAPTEARFLHLMAEAFGHAFVDNVTFYGDPDVVESPVAGLASPDFAATRAAGISLGRAAPRPLAPGDPWRFEPVGRPPGGTERGPSAGAATGTSQVAAADAEGNMAALITTIGNDFGSLVLVPGTGIFLNSGMNNFDPRPRRPNSIAPGKMPFFAVPSIVAARDGRGVLAACGSGGYRILSGVVHAFVNVVDFGMDVGDAVGAPRVYCQANETYVDARLSGQVHRELERLGHVVIAEMPAPAHEPFGRVSAAVAEADGALSAASDPAWSGGAVAAESL